MLFGLGMSTSAAEIDAILDRPQFSGSLIGAYVCSMDGEEIYSRNPDVRCMPASNQKILSVAYALEKLGPAYRPKTRFWKTSSGIYVDAPGDPSMTYAQLKSLAARLGKNVAKRVYVKQGYRPGYGPGWEWDDLPNRYAPTISAFTFDYGGFELWGNAQRVWIKPESFGIRINFQGGGDRDNRFDLAQRILTVYSKKPSTEGFLEGFALPDPDRLAARIFGGTLLNAVSLPNGTPHATWTGKSVKEMAADCLQPSNNFLAESLMFLAASKDGALPRDSYTEARKRMKDFYVKTVGADAEGIDPYDGSGLSRHNNVTPRALSEVFRWASGQPWVSVWRESMAHSGVGTLKNRLKGSTFFGKTGTLNKVSSLTGCVTNKDGRQIVVSLMFNHYLASDASVRDAQDEIIRILETGESYANQDGAPTHTARTVSHADYRTAYGNRFLGPRFDRFDAQAGSHR